MVPGKHYGLDIAGPFFNGFYIELLIDYVSRYPLILVGTGDITSRNIPKWMKDQWELYGYPSGIVTDNGPPDNGVTRNDRAKGGSY